MKNKMRIERHALRIRFIKATESYAHLCEKYGDDTPVAMGAMTKVHRLGIELKKRGRYSA